MQLWDWTGMTNPTQRSLVQRIAIVAAFFFQIATTALPSLGFGEPIGDRSDSIRTLITPSGWAFAIWGPLYLGTGIFAIWQALPRQKCNALLGRAGWFVTGALAGNGVWALYTQFENLTAISALIILFVLFCLLAILRQLVFLERDFTTGERWIFACVFSALAAWLTAASIVNISASLVYHGFQPSDLEAPITAAIIVVGGVIAAVAVMRSRGNPWYAAVFLWALLAIYFKGGQESALVSYAAIVAGVLVLIAAAKQLSTTQNRAHWLG